jgi:hypothetical protein
MARRESQKLSDLSPAERDRLEQAVLADARKKIESATPETVKSAVCYLFNGSPIIVAAVCAEVERVEGTGTGWQ